MIGGREVIPEGAIIKGRIVHLERPGRIKGLGQIRLSEVAFEGYARTTRQNAGPVGMERTNPHREQKEWVLLRLLPQRPRHWV